MEEWEALTYKRTVLVESLKEELQKRENEREEKRKKAEERNKKARNQLVELIDAHPEFLVAVAARVDDLFYGDNYRLGTELFKEQVESAYGGYDAAGDRKEQVHDADLHRLVRVYEKADDETVKVSVNDEVYRYL